MASPLPSPGFCPSPQTNIPDVSEKLMKLKVLYTFDNDNKTNCLARWPHMINVKTVNIDQTTIGVVELKTCIQAIVSASPEIVAQLGQDYTVYAYDYSEYETPLVGQGMLSWALASASGSHVAPAHQSHQLITGRVSSNLLGILHGAAQETLEVKLRLVPVPTCMQTEYMNTMEKSKELGRATPQGVESAAWRNFLDSNQQWDVLADKLVSSPPVNAPGQSNAVAGMEMVGMLIDQGHSNSNSSNLPPYAGTSAANSPMNFLDDPLESYTPAGSPASFFIADSELQEITNMMQPRPSSQASIGRRQSMQSTVQTVEQTSIRSMEQMNENSLEEGPARKRARVMRTKWDGKSNLPAPDSLRVAASNAASMRIHRPIARTASGINQEALEGPPRVPTPRPGQLETMQPRSGQLARSRLGMNDNSQPNSPVNSVYPPSKTPGEDEGIGSPDETRSQTYSYSPCDIPSSPPVFPTSLTAPSSPSLPRMQMHEDSGFMSGAADEGTDQPDKGAPSQAAELQMCFETPGPQELLPTKILPRTKATVSVPNQQNKSDSKRKRSASKPRARSRRPSEARPASRTGPIIPTSDAAEPSLPPNIPFYQPMPRLNRANSMSSLKLPQVAASDPIHPGVSSLDRCQSWTGGDHPMTDAPTPADMPNPTQSRSGSGAARKRAIQEKLISAVSAGEMPTYCDNCGAIETPTWRKAWSKILYGTKQELKLDQNEVRASFLVVESSEKDEDGETIAFRVIKKSILQTDQGFKEMTLCNPCGIWLSKFKSMRPEEKWMKQRAEKKRRKPAKKKSIADATSPTETESGAGLANQPTPSDVADDDNGDGDQADNEIITLADELPPLLPDKRRATSAEPQLNAKPPGSSMDKLAAEAALRRAIQSSPARLAGGVENIPIDMGAMGSTRRLLFPSPRKAGEFKLLDPNDKSSQSPLRKTPLKSNLVGDQPIDVKSTPSPLVGDADITGCNGSLDFADLFEFDTLSPSKTPVRRSPRNHKGPLQTPLKEQLRTSPSRGRTGGSGRSSFADLFDSAVKAGIFQLESPARGGPVSTRDPLKSPSSPNSSDDDEDPVTKSMNQLQRWFGSPERDQATSGPADRGMETAEELAYLETADFGPFGFDSELRDDVDQACPTSPTPFRTRLETEAGMWGSEI